MQNNQSPEKPAVSPPTEARAGRIVRGGAIRRILLISIPLAIIALIAVFFFA